MFYHILYLFSSFEDNMLSTSFYIIVLSKWRFCTPEFYSIVRIFKSIPITVRDKKNYYINRKLEFRLLYFSIRWTTTEKLVFSSWIPYTDPYRKPYIWYISISARIDRKFDIFVYLLNMISKTEKKTGGDIE